MMVPSKQIVVTVEIYTVIDYRPTLINSLFILESVKGTTLILTSVKLRNINLNYVNSILKMQTS